MSSRFKKLISAVMCAALILTSLQMPIQAASGHDHAALMASSDPAPVVEITGVEVYDKMYTCDAPTLVVTSAAGLKRVRIYGRDYGTKENNYQITEKNYIVVESFDDNHSYSYTVPAQKEYQGAIFIEAIDVNERKTTSTAYYGHYLGVRSSVIVPPTCHDKGYTEMTYYCKYCKKPYYSYRYSETNTKEHTYSGEIDNTVANPCNMNGENVTLNQRICTVCGEVKTEVINGSEDDYNENEHNWVSEGAPKGKTATCDEYGCSYQICSDCKAIRVDPESNRQRPAGHKPGQEYVLTPASCTQAEVRAKKCEVCDEIVSRTTVGTAPGHQYDLSGIEVDCKEGYTGEATCQVCGEVGTVTIDPAEHKFELQVVKPATCTEEGKKAYVCSVCGTVSEEFSQTIPALGHTPDPDDNDCSTPVLCSVCGDVVKEAQNHEFSNDYNTKNADSSHHWTYCTHDGCNAVNKVEHTGTRPSCTEPYVCDVCGTTVYTPGTHSYVPVKENNLWHYLICEICGFKHPTQRYHNMTDDGDCLTPVVCECGHVYREAKPNHVYSEIPARNDADTHTYTCINNGCQYSYTEAHQYTVTEEIIEPVKCLEDGKKKVIKTCVCGDIVETEEIIPHEGHKFGEWEEVESTCTSAGSKKRRCEICGYDEIIDLGISNHIWGTEYIVDKEATCSSEGTESIHCTVCDAVNPDAQRTIPMTEHTPGEYEILASPTCTEPGRRIQKCAVCQAEMGDEEEIPANGHTWGEAEHIGAATCTEPGKVQYTCMVCRTIDGPKECPEHKALGHTFVWRNNNDAAIGKNETRTPVCSVCGYVDEEHTEEIPNTALHEHSYIEWTYNNDATCYEDGTQSSICDICKNPDTKITKPAPGTKLDHVFTNYVSNGDATCQKDGTETAECANGCGTFDTRDDVGSRLPHKFEEYVYNNDATCLEDGTEVAICAYGCSETDVRRKTGTKLSHSFTFYVSDGNVTCDSMGTETAECDYECGTTHTRNAGGTPSHIWGTPTFKWSDDCLTAEIIFTCERDKTHVRTVPAEVTWATENATCEEDGKTVYGFEVDIDGVKYADKREVVIPATGHNYLDPIFTWSDDFSSAEATFICHNDESHVIKKAATVTKEIVDAGSCESGEIHLYTATVELDGKTYTGTQTDSLPAAGHDFGEPVFEFSADGKTATAKVVCKKNEDHFIDLDVTVTSKTKTDADCENDGVTLYTATAEFEGKTYTAEKEVSDIPAKGHSYGAPVISWSDDCKNATAVFTCANDSSHTETVEGKMSQAVTSAPTCETPGITTYTAEFVFGGMSYIEDKAVSDIPATGHNYVKGVCTVCGAKEDHDHFSETYVTDKDSHWKNCDKCGEMFAFGTHTFEGDTCTVCGYERPHIHQFGEYKSDQNGHWKECSTCGETDEKSAHEFKDGKCSVCGYECKHSYGDSYITDETNHWKECKICGKATEKSAHQFVGDKCSICGHERDHVHSYGDSYEFDYNCHWKVCEGCGEATGKENHSFVGIKCVVCGYSRPVLPNGFMPQNYKQLNVENVNDSENIYSEVVNAVRKYNGSKINGVFYISLGSGYSTTELVRVRVYAPGAIGSSKVLIRDGWTKLENANISVNGDYVEFTVSAGLISQYHYFAIVTTNSVDIEIPQQGKINCDVECEVR